jgi:hypothetical protein
MHCCTRGEIRLITSGSATAGGDAATSGFLICLFPDAVRVRLTRSVPCSIWPISHESIMICPWATGRCMHGLYNHQPAYTPTAAGENSRACEGEAPVTVFPKLSRGPNARTRSTRPFCASCRFACATAAPWVHGQGAAIRGA